MSDKKPAPQKEERKRIEAERAKVTGEYECGGECRICPFPGAKCTPDAENWKRIH